MALLCPARADADSQPPQATNFVGALDPKSGEIIWRHSLGDTESVEAIAQEGRMMASVSGGGRYLRVWTATEGFLLWDAPTNVAGPVAAVDVKFVGDVDDDNHDDIAVAVGHSVLLFSGAKGKRLWLWQSDDKKLQLTRIVHADKAGSIKVVGMKSAGSAIDTVVDINAKLGSSKTGAALLGRSCSSIAVLAESMACVEASGKTLYTWALSAMTQSSHALDSLSPGTSIDAAAVRLDTATGKDVALVHLSADACVAVRVSTGKAVLKSDYIVNLYRKYARALTLERCACPKGKRRASTLSKALGQARL